MEVHLLTYELVEKLKAAYMSSEKWYSVRWHYIEGCILKAYLDSYEQTGSERDYNFVKSYMDQLFDASGNIYEIQISSYNIDQIRMAGILFTLYQREREPKYKRIMDMLYQQLASYPRTSSARSGIKKTTLTRFGWMDCIWGSLSMSST